MSINKGFSISGMKKHGLTMVEVALYDGDFNSHKREPIYYG